MHLPGRSWNTPIGHGKRDAGGAVHSHRLGVNCRRAQTRAAAGRGRHACGWRGDDPPYHAPVFVLTHHPREPQPISGGTTYYFVTDGIESALAQAREAAGDGDVAIMGGATTINQYLAAGLLDELRLDIAPFTLGAGTRLFDGVPPLNSSR